MKIRYLFLKARFARQLKVEISCSQIQIGVFEHRNCSSQTGSQTVRTSSLFNYPNSRKIDRKRENICREDSMVCDGLYSRQVFQGFFGMFVKHKLIILIQSKLKSFSRQVHEKSIRWQAAYFSIYRSTEFP